MTFLIVNNIISPYRTRLFEKIYSRALSEGGLKLQVRYLARSEKVRSWKSRDLHCWEAVFPALIRFRNPRTPTSDIIINYGFLRDLIKAESICLFGYNYATYLMIMMLSKFLKKRMILFFETTGNDKERNKFKEFFKSKMLQYFFDDYIVSGSTSYEYLKNLVGEGKKIHFSVNGCESPVLFLGHGSSDSTKIVYIGRLASEKNLKFAISCLKSSVINFKLDLIGEGPEKRDLKTLIGDDPRFSFFDHMEHQELMGRIQDYDVLLLPSLSEPWGMVVNEALSSGLALLISKHVGASRDLVGSNGCIFSPHDKSDFMHALANVVKNKEAMRASSIEMANRHTVDGQAKVFFECAMRKLN